VNILYHVGCVESYRCIGMCRQVIHELFCFEHGILCSIRLFAGNCAEGHENGEVNSSGVIEDASNDALHMLDVILQ
jgi:hypothetical protein